MRGVMLEVPSHLLQERARTDAGRFDEMWEGVLHMVPPPSQEHQRIGLGLIQALLTPVAGAGLLLRYEIGLFDPEVPGFTSYRQPDIAVFDEVVSSERGIEGAASLVIEIRSPGDESLEKLAFYERVGVAEVVIVDRDTKGVTLWSREGPGLTEQPLGPGGAVTLQTLSVTLRPVGGRLELAAAAGRVLI